MKYNKNLFNNNKRGVSAYIGFVLLTAFVVSLSTFVYFWMTDHVESQAESIKGRADESLCEVTAITAMSFCQDDYSFIINVTNTKNTNIEGFKFQLFDLYDEPLEYSLNLSLKPSVKEHITILKHGTLAQVEITPFIKKDGLIACRSSKIVLNPIEMC